MPNGNQKKKYDLEDRTLTFAKRVRKFVRQIPKDQCNLEDARQLIRSSGSVGANYIEANEALSKKDFLLRLKISKKEAKESTYWLKLLSITDESLTREQDNLIEESKELMNIFGAIIQKVQ